VLCGALGGGSPVPAQATPAAAPPLPREVLAALERARVPPEAIVVYVQELGRPDAPPRLAHREREPVNPGSLAKLLPTAAALDLLGPAWQWSTPVWATGALRAGVLEGDLAVRGSGDPKLVLERVWLLLRRVQELGVREVRGDIVLDGSAFAPAAGGAADFDGEALRPYNVQPDALLLNHKALTYGFVPDAARGVAWITVQPALAGQGVEGSAPSGAASGTTPSGAPSLPLTAGPCEAWREAVKASFEPGRTRFAGSYPAACGEQAWPVADAAPATYNARLVEALWREMGGRLGGRVRDGVAPLHLKPWFEFRSPPLAEVVRDINKFSNNVMAQQLFLTLPIATAGPAAAPVATPPTAPVATAEAARELLRGWVRERLGEPPPGFVIDNGSGLSRETRVTAAWLVRLLQWAWEQPLAPDFYASLPLSGHDGTMRRARGAGAGRAHLKTGSLRDVAGIAGLVHAAGGRRFAVAAVIHHPNANAARPALEALVQHLVLSPAAAAAAEGARPAGRTP
jgi:D-alanyl-D-alanine carboxypeptidase/D-alanyl-D-alanine-endopeptidase (penicillin-binding protein 4)